VLSYDALADGVPADHIVKRIVQTVPLPQVAPRQRATGQGPGSPGGPSVPSFGPMQPGSMQPMAHGPQGYAPDGTQNGGGQHSAPPNGGPNGGGAYPYAPGPHPA
jgi:MoxR-like ATPase